MMQLDKWETARRIVDEIRRAITAPGRRDAVVGILEDGSIGHYLRPHSRPDMVVEVVDLSEGWTLGDWDGDPTDPSTWTSDQTDGLVQLFAESWLDDILTNPYAEGR